MTQFTVWVGAPHSVPDLANSVPLLVIDPDPEALDQLRASISGRDESVPIVMLNAVVAHEADVVLDWYIFNDSRLNGKRDQSYWQQYFPNVELLDKVQRRTKTLEELLDSFQHKMADIPLECGDLLVQKGDPLDALNGSGYWLRQFDTITIRIPEWTAQWQDPLDEWLKRKGFTFDYQKSLSWKRDAMISLGIDFYDSQQKCQLLEEQISAHAVRLLVAQEALVEIQSQYKNVVKDNDDLRHTNVNLSSKVRKANRRIDVVTSVRDNLKQELDSVLAENASVIAEVTKLCKQKHALSDHHDQLKVRFRQLQKKFSHLGWEKSDLQARLDTLIKQSAVLDKELERIKHKNNELVASHNIIAEDNSQLGKALHESQLHCERLDAERVQHKKKADSLSQDNHKLKEQYIELQKEKNMLIEQANHLKQELKKSDQTSKAAVAQKNELMKANQQLSQEQEKLRSLNQSMRIAAKRRESRDETIVENIKKAVRILDD